MSEKETGTLGPRGAQISTELLVKYVERNDWVTFAELHNYFGGTDGDREITVGKNVLFWSGMSKEFVEAFRTAWESGKISLSSGDFLSYLADGKVLNIPMVRSKRKYKTPHWMVLVMRPGNKGEITHERMMELLGGAGRDTGKGYWNDAEGREESEDSQEAGQGEG